MLPFEWMAVGLEAGDYVTVEATTDDGFTPDEANDDYLASFSATGPTYDGFIKPDVVAPGGHLWALMPGYTLIAQVFPEFMNDGDFDIMDPNDSQGDGNHRLDGEGFTWTGAYL